MFGINLSSLHFFPLFVDVPLVFFMPFLVFSSLKCSAILSELEKKVINAFLSLCLMLKQSVGFLLPLIVLQRGWLFKVFDIYLDYVYFCHCTQMSGK